MKRQTIFTILILLLIGWSLFADDIVELRQISPNTWMHTSYEMVNGYRTDSNGLVINCSNGIVLVDTCWNNTQTIVLIDKIGKQFQKSILIAIITHAHSDRIGGIGALYKNGIKAVSTLLTTQFAKKAGYALPSPELESINTNLCFGDTKIEAFFPGAGHTKDNIVVWIPDEHVLFGGCLIKSMPSTNLGNMGNADISSWASSVRSLQSKFTNIRIVVPGHGLCGGVELLQHTIDLCPAK